MGAAQAAFSPLSPGLAFSGMEDGREREGFASVRRWERTGMGAQRPRPQDPLVPDHHRIDQRPHSRPQVTHFRWSPQKSFFHSDHPSAVSRKFFLHLNSLLGHKQALPPGLSASSAGFLQQCLKGMLRSVGTIKALTRIVPGQDCPAEA